MPLSVGQRSVCFYSFRRNPSLGAFRGYWHHEIGFGRFSPGHVAAVLRSDPEPRSESAEGVSTRNNLIPTNYMDNINNDLCSKYRTNQSNWGGRYDYLRAKSRDLQLCFAILRWARKGSELKWCRTLKWSGSQCFLYMALVIRAGQNGDCRHNCQTKLIALLLSSGHSACFSSCLKNWSPQANLSLPCAGASGQIRTTRSRQRSGYAGTWCTSITVWASMVVRWRTRVRRCASSSHSDSSRWTWTRRVGFSP